jgi:hypothetical protein
MADAADWPIFDYSKLEQRLDDARGDKQLFDAIVNTPFQINRPEVAFLFLGIIVLLLVDKKTGSIKRIALSQTELAKNTTDVSYKRFEDIVIPLDHTDNILAKAIQTGKPQDTTDWKSLFEPALTAEQARLNQASGGIAYSAVRPLKARDGGAMIFSYFQYLHGIGDAQREFMEKYSQLVDKRLMQS